MKKIITLLYLALLVTSCGQDYNSNYNDRGTYADSGIPSGSPLYNAYVVIQNKCFTCHGSQWQDYKTSQQWIDAGLVIKDNYTNSKIIYRLKNYGGDMHSGPYSQLTSSETDALRTWINSI